MHPFNDRFAAIHTTFARRYNALRAAVRNIASQISMPLRQCQHKPQPQADQHSTAIPKPFTDGVIVCNDQDQILMLNQAARVLLQLQPDQPAPSSFHHLPMTKLSHHNVTSPDIYQMNGVMFHVLASSFHDAEGTKIGRMYILRDCTDCMDVDRARTTFIATLSHELRTPLMVLSGNTDLLMRGSIGTLTREQQSLIESMRNHTQRMTTLVNNVITLAALESGTLTMDLKPVPVANVIDEVTEPFRRALASRNINLVVDVAPDIPLVLADHCQLAIVLQQLLDNAQRYTHHGQVLIRTSYNQQHVRIDIADTGCGMTPEATATLFTRFSRTVDRINTADRGFGLGLALARELIHRQGGQIWLAETSACGSVFSITIPYAQVLGLSVASTSPHTAPLGAIPCTDTQLWPHSPWKHSSAHQMG